MLQTTPAIVLSLQKHSDKASILHTYTRAYGRMNFIVYGAGSRRKSAAQFAPLSVVELSFDLQPTREIQTLSDISLRFIPQHDDMLRQCLRMYVAEVIYRCIHHPLMDEQVYDYVDQVARDIDTSSVVAGDDESRLVHLVQEFTQHLSELLGYGGEPMEELSNVKSLDIIQTLMGAVTVSQA